MDVLVLVYQMCCSIRTIYFFIFVYSSVAFTAHVQHFASVAISTQHIFSPPVGALSIVEIGL